MSKKKILILTAASAVLGVGVYALIKAKKSCQSMEECDCDKTDESCECDDEPRGCEESDCEKTNCPTVEKDCLTYHTIATVVEEPNHLDEETTVEQLKDVNKDEMSVKDEEVNELSEVEHPTNTRKRRVKKSVEDPTVNTNKNDEN